MIGFEKVLKMCETAKKNLPLDISGSPLLGNTN